MIWLLMACGDGEGDSTDEGTVALREVVGDYDCPGTGDRLTVEAPAGTLSADFLVCHTTEELGTWAAEYDDELCHTLDAATPAWSGRSHVHFDGCYPSFEGGWLQIRWLVQD